MNSQRMIRSYTTRLILLLTVGLLAIALPACGSGRSVEAFCATVSSEKGRIQSQLDASLAQSQASEDDLIGLIGALGGGLQAYSEMNIYFTKLSKVAPEDIQVETELLARKFDEAMEVPDLSIGGLANTLMNGFELSGPMNRVNQYSLANCGESL